MSSTMQFMKSLVKTGYDNYQKSRSRGEDEGDILKTITKNGVLMESRTFNDSQLIPKRCRSLLAKIVYLINQGEKFSESESTTLFFSITKLFQSSNKELRRMIYLAVKEMRNEDSVYILTSSITKDINSKDDLFRMNSIRMTPVIAQHTDPQNLQQIERYIKNSLADNNPSVASASLLAGLQLMYIDYHETIRKWQTEVLDRLKSKSTVTHYHALSLLHEIKAHDQMGFTKVLTVLAKEKLDNIATLQLIRFAKEVLTSGVQLDHCQESVLVDLIRRNVHKGSDMVSLEACRAYVDIKQLDTKDVQQAVAVLLLFLTNEHNSVIKFSALKTLNRLINSPLRAELLVSTQEIHDLINDNNRSIATIAVSLLLKICKEEQVQKLLDQILEYLQEISDEFKQDIMRSIRSLIKRTKNQYKFIMGFLLKCLDQEGSVDFKKSIVSLVGDTLQEKQREFALLGLMEYIEDCEHQGIHIMILDLLDEEIEKGGVDASKFIRFIYNRVTLEDTPVRSKAVSTLGKIGLMQPTLRPQILQLFNALLLDEEDEIRDKAAFYIETIDSHHNLFFQEQDTLSFHHQVNIIESLLKEQPDANIDIQLIQQYSLQNGLTSNQQSNNLIHQYENDHNSFEEEQQDNKLIQEPIKYKIDSQMFESNPLFSEYGPVLLQKEKINLTEQDFEIGVSVTKYLFGESIILEFLVDNKLENTYLLDVRVEVETNVENLQVQHVERNEELRSGEKKIVRVGLAINPENKILLAQLNCYLRCNVREYNGQSITSEYQEEYQLDDIEFTLADCLLPRPIDSYEKEFNRLKQEGHYQETTLQLPYKSLEQAISGLLKHFPISACENTQKLDISNLKKKHSHQLKLSGCHLVMESTLIISCLLGFDSNYGCVLKCQVLAMDENILNGILESLCK